MKNIQTISIKCETKDTLELAELTELQGGLKERTDVDYDKIKLSIIKFGFSFPLFVWKSGKTNYLLDGHGRFATLCKMQKDGYIIPPLPVVFISAKNKAEAKQKLLRLNSQYGKMTKESVLEFAEDIELNFDEVLLPFGTIDFSEEPIDLNYKDESETGGGMTDNFQLSLTFPIEYKERLEAYGRRNIEKDVMKKIDKGEI